MLAPQGENSDRKPVDLEGCGQELGLRVLSLPMVMRGQGQQGWWGEGE